MVRIIKKTFNTTVSVKEGASRSVLRGIIQYDTLNEVNIRLSDGSKAFDYTGYTNIVFKVLKADGTSYIDSEGENVIATSPVDGIITVNLTGQATAAAGLCQSVIEIYSGDGKMTTARFNYEVFEALDTDEGLETVAVDESENYYPVFQNLMADLSELEASIEVAEAQRVTAELARASSAAGYVAQAEAAKTAAKASAATAEEWAKQAKAVAGGNFAPDGYGLGEEPPFVEDLNDALLNGWYKAIGNTTKNYPSLITGLGGAYGVLFVQTRGDYKYQELRYKNEIAVRYYDGNAWSEWEYVNPPMAVGVEYRTTERYMGRPVYTKMVDFGANTNGKSVTVAYDVYQTVRCEAQAGGSTTYPWLRFQSDTEWVCCFHAERQKITDSADENYGKWGCVVRCFAGTSASGAYSTNFVRVWYTKTTDT